MSTCGGRPFGLLRDNVQVIGADPGKTTGLARLHDGYLETAAVPFEDVDPIVRAWLADTSPGVVAVERFVITRNTAKKTQQTDALKLSGVIENLVVRDPRHIIVYQNMSDAKKIGNPQLLRGLGWWRTGKNARHMNDALSQVIMLIARRYPEWMQTNVTPDII